MIYLRQISKKKFDKLRNMTPEELNKIYPRLKKLDIEQIFFSDIFDDNDIVKLKADFRFNCVKIPLFIINKKDINNIIKEIQKEIKEEILYISEHIKNGIYNEDIYQYNLPKHVKILLEFSKLIINFDFKKNYLISYYE